MIIFTTIVCIMCGYLSYIQWNSDDPVSLRWAGVQAVLCILNAVAILFYVIK